MRIALLIFAAVLAWAQTPAEVLDVLRVVGQALSDRNAPLFLEQFDAAMPGYKELEANVAALVSAGPVATTFEIARDTGDAARRELLLDVLLRVGAGAPKRGRLKMVFERRDQKWVIVSLDRPDVFRPSLLPAR